MTENRSLTSFPMLRKLLVAVLVIVVVTGVAGVLLIRRSFPIVDGTVSVAGLEGEVHIVRDTWGVPHIYAQSIEDLYLAQGYVHAQDRFWQMDFWRHIGSGRLSELVGESQVETDAFLRTLGFARIAHTELEMMSPEARSWLEAYSKGVNAYLADHGGSRLSFEYVMLPLVKRGYEPEPWQPVNTLTWAKMMAWELRGNMDTEIARATLSNLIGSDRTDELYPPYRPDRPVIAGQGGSAFEGAAVALDLGSLGERIASRVAAVDEAFGPAGEGIGSNNWVVSGKLTDTGLPLLANDPHLGIQMPSIWYEVGLHCSGTGPGCPLDVVGFSFPGTPGVIVGHNDRIAWGVTNLGPDVMDLYIEKVDPNDRGRYEVNGEWAEFQTRTETIFVAGGDLVTIEVQTSRNGPIISGRYGALDEAELPETPDQFAVALKWTALEPTNLVQSILDLNRAGSYEEFRAALRLWDVPAQNFVYADVEGNIAYQMPGRVPIRARGNGMAPVPGWIDDYQWTGFIPFDELPAVLNPPEGFIVTANNAVVGGSYPYFVSAEWAYGTGRSASSMS